MRRYILLIFFCFNAQLFFAQEIEHCETWEVNFDEPILEYCTSFFTINDGLDEGGVWQIGPPQKEFLNFAYNDEMVIITDTINPYPINDTSSFTINHIVGELSFPGGNLYSFTLRGAYFSQLDEGDVCKMEYSVNQGESWYDLVDPIDEQGYYVSWHSEIPDFSVQTNDWELFDLEWSILLKYEENGDEIQVGDTLQVRFSLLSDTTSGNAEGIMFDSFWLEQNEESVFDSNYRIFNSSARPNPTLGLVEITFSNPNALETDVTIFNQVGQDVYSVETVNGNVEIDLGHLPKGIYTYRLLQEKVQSLSRGKIVKVE